MSMQSTGTTTKNSYSPSESLSRSASTLVQVPSQPKVSDTSSASSKHLALSTTTNSTSTSISLSNAQPEYGTSVIAADSYTTIPGAVPQDKNTDAFYFGSNETSRPPVMWAKPVGTSTITHAVSGSSGIISVVTYSGLDEGGLPASTVWGHWLILVATGFAVVTGTSGVEVLDPYAAEVSAGCASKYFSGRNTFLILLALVCLNNWS